MNCVSRQICPVNRCTGIYFCFENSLLGHILAIPQVPTRKKKSAFQQGCDSVSWSYNTSTILFRLSLPTMPCVRGHFLHLAHLGKTKRQVFKRTRVRFASSKFYCAFPPRPKTIVSQQSGSQRAIGWLLSLAHC